MRPAAFLSGAGVVASIQDELDHPWSLKRRSLWLAALLFCAYLVSVIVDFLGADRCMDAGGRWIAAETRCEF